jgi:hypothetical protein
MMGIGARLDIENPPYDEWFLEDMRHMIMTMI